MSQPPGKIPFHLFHTCSGKCSGQTWGPVNINHTNPQPEMAQEHPSIPSCLCSRSCFPKQQYYILSVLSLQPSSPALHAGGIERWASLPWVPSSGLTMNCANLVLSSLLPLQINYVCSSQDLDPSSDLPKNLPPGFLTPSSSLALSFLWACRWPSVSSLK